MRNILRKFWTIGSQRDRAFFIAPIVVVLLLLLLGFASQNVEVLASVWRDPLSVLAARSPGYRNAGALYNIKQKRLAQFGPGRSYPTGIVPHERVLAATRVRPDPILPAFLPGDEPLALFGDGPLDRIDSGFLPTTTSFGSPGPTPLPIGTTPLFDVSAFSNPTPSPTPTSDVPPSATTALPEPSTWLMNIAGLFAIGGLMRHGKRRNRGTAQAITV